MARMVYKWDEATQKMVELSPDDKPKEYFHTVITDDVPQGMQHPADGSWHTSKSNFRKTTRAHGCVEVGNETQSNRETELSKSERREDIKKVLHDTGIYKG